MKKVKLSIVIANAVKQSKNNLRDCFVISFLAITLLILNSPLAEAQSNKPWTDNQLIAPADLAQILNDSTSKKPILLSIGFGGGIKGSKEMGAASDKEGLEKLRQEVSNLPKDADIVIFCGCCPFWHCPNVRPAFKLLNEMKFTNHKLLNLSHNLRVDWIKKGYPMNK